jgi:prepilin-type N-terminal cleavage/methylation domain-containing protein
MKGNTSPASGFSLPELMVVLIVSSTLLATALLAYRPMLARWRLDAAARQIVMDLKVARVSAIAESTDHRIVFPVPGTFYRHEARQPFGTYGPAAPPTSLPFGVETIECTALGASVTFRPRGHASTFGSITLRNAEGDHRQIVVDMAGRMRVR